ncbi:LPXTG cell wall anchor domain-containing protein [Lysinibacter cavernae]|uniref:LPXTG-motif cell wall-anchored protein n=1 Tax=Lysinibacter cavernae TaxID=1640652 RepID=A0A7X5TU92_9MICO|nr:LPXTG cell wall anchor domain-containing protein [Lysinibacter cavernae]NIH55030.1 LPXTG-motif cell wall-anchored protein [Lysinibacter cavernae]
MFSTAVSASFDSSFAFVAAASNGLASTGQDIALMVIIGAVVLIAGAALIIAGRIRRRKENEEALFTEAVVASEGAGTDAAVDAASAAATESSAEAAAKLDASEDLTAPAVAESGGDGDLTDVEDIFEHGDLPPAERADAPTIDFGAPASTSSPEAGPADDAAPSSDAADNTPEDEGK